MGVTWVRGLSWAVPNVLRVPPLAMGRVSAEELRLGLAQQLMQKLFATQALRPAPTDLPFFPSNFAFDFFRRVFHWRVRL